MVFVKMRNIVGPFRHLPCRRYNHRRRLRLLGNRPDERVLIWRRRPGAHQNHLGFVRGLGIGRTGSGRRAGPRIGYIRSRPEGMLLGQRRADRCDCRELGSHHCAILGLRSARAAASTGAVVGRDFKANSGHICVTRIRVKEHEY
jgi:hypothetical protein